MRRLHEVCLTLALLSGMAMAQSIQGPRTVYFDKINVCPGRQTSPKPCSLSRKMTYSVVADTIFGKTKVVTQGTPNLDFKLSGTTCKGRLAAGTQCTVRATFAPLAPGVRMGAVELTDSSGNLLIATLVSGEGQGPIPIFAYSPLVTVPLGTPISLGFAVDAAGNIFAGAYGGITKFSQGSWAPTTFGSVAMAGGVSIDGDGNIYASDSLYNVVVKINPETNTQVTIGEGLRQPLGVAVDKWGNVFISDSGNNRAVKVSALTGAQTTLFGGFTGGIPNLGQPAGIAMDGADNVFVADQINEVIWELPKGNADNLMNVGEALIPTGVAVDAAGNVFIADSAGDDIAEFPAGGGTESFLVPFMIGPWALALDGAGNLFIAQETGTLSELKASKTLTLNFGKVAVGSTSEPQYVSIQNAGNQPLTAVPPGLSIGTGFLQMAPNGTSPGCTEAFSLSPGGGCNMGISFVPQVSGKITGWATFTDNALNKAPSATQSVKLKGIGIQ